MKPLTVKRLPDDTLSDVRTKNEARLLAGKALIVVRVCACSKCGKLFESIRSRTCGC